MLEIQQSLGIYDRKLIDSTRLKPTHIERLRDAAIGCPVCGERSRIIIGKDGPLFSHTGNHEPEDVSRYQMKKRLVDQLTRLFPESAIDLNIDLEDADLGYADLAIARSNGARFVITYRSAEMRAAAASARTSKLLEMGIRNLWLLDYRRLTKKARRGAATQIGAVTMKSLETTLLASGEPLLYAEPERRTVHWVTPPQAAIELAEGGLGRLGRIDCLIRRYLFSQLRLREGRWWADAAVFEDPPPPAPPLPERLLGTPSS